MHYAGPQSRPRMARHVFRYTEHASASFEYRFPQGAKGCSPQAAGLSRDEVSTRAREEA